MNEEDRSEVYFAADQPQIWRWAGEGCSEIEWVDGPLIVFRMQLVAVLEQLPGNWPRLTELLLLLAACRSNWPEHRNVLQPLLSEVGRVKPLQVAQILVGLDRLHALPSAQRQSPRAQARLAKIVFDGGIDHGLGLDEQHLQFLKVILPQRVPNDLVAPRHDPMVPPLSAEVRFSIAKGLERISPVAVENREATGLESTVEPAPVVVPEEPATHSGRLAQWLNDSELFGVARLARRLMSVLSWPQPVARLDQQALGGVSDLSNRGTLDRLLLNELAHDDDTLAMRVALNEALYLRREAPPEAMARTRAVFVDAGLRLWGRPRIFAASVAAALAAAEDREQELTVRVAVADREGWRAVDARTRAGMLELLSALSPRLSPAAEVLAWSREWSRLKEPCEAVIVTAFETFEDAAFQQALGSLPGGEYFVALVDGTGRFELRRRTAHGLQTLRRLELNLEELLTPPRDTKPLPLTSGPDRLPAILRLERMPLRLTCPIRQGNTWPVGKVGLMSLTSDGRVLWWSDPQIAAEELGSAEHTGRVLAWRTLEARESAHPWSCALVCRGTWSLLKVHVGSGRIETLPLQAKCMRDRMPVQAFFTCWFAVLMNDLRIEAFSIEDGRRLGEIKTPPGTRSFGNRYLRTDQGVMGLIRTSELGVQGLALELIHPDFQGIGWLDPQMAGRKIAGLRSMIGRDGCLTTEIDPRPQVHGRGRAARFELQDEPFHCWQQEQFVAISGTFRSLDGSTWYSGPSTLVSDLTEETPHWGQYHAMEPSYAIVRKAMEGHKHEHTLRHKFVAVAVDRGGMWLQSSRNTWWKLILVNDHLEWVQQPAPVAGTIRVGFEVLHWRSLTKQLRRAKLPGGREVWLDKRGLLHLLPGDNTLPELTLVLDPQRCSGWASDGTFWGDRIYTGDSVPKLPVPEVWERWLKPFWEGAV